MSSDLKTHIKNILYYRFNLDEDKANEKEIKEAITKERETLKYHTDP